MRNLQELLGPTQVQVLIDAPLIMGTRHPTWFPMFNPNMRAVDFLVQGSIFRIAHVPGGEDWLKAKVHYLMDFDEINNASSALAEIRAYGALLEAGFQVFPIPHTDDSTPDFEVDAGEGRITVEIAAKHQDAATDQQQVAIHSGGELPEDVHRSERVIPGKGKITTTVASITPGGKPDPNKPNDSVQANLVSKVCSIKQDERQIPDDKPAVLVMDFANFGGPNIAEMQNPGDAAPVQTGHQHVTCGPFWYGLYGWKGAPLFESGMHRLVHMQHPGRFRLTGAKKSKLSAVLLVLSKSSSLLENPWAERRLPEKSRLTLTRYPWFDLTRSIGDWTPGDAAKQIELQEHLIKHLEQNYQGFWGF